MTSLLETTSTAQAADYKAAMETAERLSSLLCGYGDVDNPQQSPLIALGDDLWKELYLLPTPPLSPESLSTADSNSTTEQASEVGDGSASSLYVNMMEYEQMMDVLEEAERVLSSDSQQSSLQQDLLLQDCMWSGGNCDGLLNNTVATNNITNITNTPTNKTSDAIGDVTLCEQNDAPPLDDNNGCSNSDDQEPDCVEPAAVFPVLRAATNDKTSLKGSSFNRSSVNTIRSRSSLSSSESEEEIDVVTVERPSELGTKTSLLTSNRTNTKKQLASSTRHSSSINSPPLRKKRHTKRLSRRVSEDGMESDEEARRASHNVLERKRRNDLKNSFDILRGGIPELEENLRAPKVVILRKAVEYIQVLQTTDQKTKVDYTREQARHKKLTERLTLLKKTHHM